MRSFSATRPSHTLRKPRMRGVLLASIAWPTVLEVSSQPISRHSPGSASRDLRERGKRLMSEGLFQGLWLDPPMSSAIACAAFLYKRETARVGPDRFRDLGQPEARVDGVSHLELLV
jgi:hypothetical protein